MAPTRFWLAERRANAISDELARVAELVDATHSKCVTQKVWGFESLHGHHA